jgi:CheY-like chemotaxis protein
MVIQGMLNRIDIYPDSAKNGKEALDKIKEKGHYDLILMDCEMPVMDGYTTTKEIRLFEADKKMKNQNSENPKDLLIVGLSAHAMADFKRRGLESGMDDYLTKPISLSAITNLLSRLRVGDTGCLYP